MKQFKRVWQFSLPEILQSMGAIAGVGLLEVLVVFLIVKVFVPDVDYALFGGFFAFMVWILIEIWAGMVTFGKTFTMMISMSRTRKEFFGNYLLVNLIGNVFKMFLVVGITLLDGLVADTFYSGLSCELDMNSFILDYRVIVAGVLLPVALRMILGVLYQKYQMIIFWIIWGITMCSGLLMNLIAKALHNESVNKVVEAVIGLIEKIANVGGVVQVLLIGLVFGVMTAVAGIMTSKQAVKC